MHVIPSLRLKLFMVTMSPGHRCPNQLPGKKQCTVNWAGLRKGLKGKGFRLSAGVNILFVVSYPSTKRNA